MRRAIAKASPKYTVTARQRKDNMCGSRPDASLVKALWHGRAAAAFETFGIEGWHLRAVPQSITSMAGIEGARDE